MSVLTQGTQVYFIDPENGSVVEIFCATAFNPGGNPADQLDDTCLADREAKSKSGLRRPGQATLTLNPEPGNDSHVRLYGLSQGDENVHFAVGWSDGTAAPTSTTDSDGGYEWDDPQPTTRTWFLFEGYVADFPFDFALNALVGSTVNIQRSGPAEWIPKV